MGLVRRLPVVLVFTFAPLALPAQHPLPPAPAATTITASGATATTVSTAGAATQVATTTVSGGNAYNGFSAFQVAPGSTVNLLIPAAASNNNLINIVSGSQTQIYGVLNSLLSDGHLGGNVFFADDQGIVIGATGVVNVGSLTLATPTSDFVSGFFNDIGDNTAALLAGTAPIAAGGLIQIAGQVHSAGPTTLAGDTIEVAGGITTGASQAAFSGMVNTSGLAAGQAITITGSTITIDGGLYGGTAQAAVNAGSDNVSLTTSQSDSAIEASTTAAITIGNAILSGQNISLAASASSTSTDTLGANLKDLEDPSSLPWEISGNAAWNTASSSATIQVGGGAGSTVLAAAGNVSLTSTADATTTVKTTAPAGSFSYADNSASANTTVGSNASITAGGAFTLASDIVNKLSLNPTAKSVSQAPAAAVSYGKASSNSTAAVAGSVSAGTVSITSDNENTFVTQANGSSTSSAGIGVAIASYSSQATTTLSGKATATGAGAGALNIAAISNNNSDEVESNSSVNAPSNSSTGSKVAGTLGSAADQLTGVPFLNKLASYLASSKKTQTNSNAGPGKLGLSAAVSYLSSSNAAATLVSGTATAGTGGATVATNASDQPQISASGSAGNNATQGLLGGGVAYAEFNNSANTTVSGALTGATGVAVTADAVLPDPFSLSDFTNVPSEFSGLDFTAPSSITDGSAYQQDFDAAVKLGGDLANLLKTSNPNGIGQFLNSSLGLNNLVTSYVNTGESANGGANGANFGVAGSVNILNVANQATATVASGATVNAASGDVDVTANANAALINLSGLAATLSNLKGKNPGAQGDLALGGSYNGITLNNGATAAVDDGATVAAANGGINVNGSTNEFLINATQAGDNAGQFGVNGSFAWITINNTALGYIQSDANATASGTVNVQAANNLTDFTIGGALGYGGNAQVGATVDWNQFNNTTEAYIGDPSNSRRNATGLVQGQNVSVIATANESLWNISLAAEAATGQTENDAGIANQVEGAGSGEEGASSEPTTYGLGISGDVALNDIRDTTLALINNGARVQASGIIGVGASDTPWALSAGLSAALVNTGDASADLAGAFARNNFSRDTEATVTDATLGGPNAGAAGSVFLSALNYGDLLTISAGGGVAMGNSGSLAGAVNNDVVTNTADAGLGTGAAVNSAGMVSVNADNDDKVLAVAGAISYGGKGGLGAALDLSTYTNNSNAYVGSGASVDAGGIVTITATTQDKAMPIAAALGLGGNLGLGGSATADSVNNTTDASIGDAVVNAGWSLVLGADDSSQLLQVVGSLGGSNQVGIGLAGAISTSSQPLFDRNVSATIASGAQVSAAGNDNELVGYQNQLIIGMLVDATAEGGADTIVAGVGGGSAVGIAASLALNYFNDNVTAAIANGAAINPGNTSKTADQSVTVNAADTWQIMDVAGEIAGAQSAALGASADVQELNRNVSAVLGGTVLANGNITASATQGGTDWSVAAAASLGGEVNLAGAASAIFDTSSVAASVAPGAVITTPDSVNIAAERDASLTTIDGELGLAADAGVGGAVSLVEQQDATSATVGAGATVTALGNGTPIQAYTALNGSAAVAPVNGLAVTAVGDDTLQTVAIGGQASGGVSVTGSVVLNDISASTSASVGSNVLINPGPQQTGANAAQTVDILASDSTSLTSGAGALALGINQYGLGLGAAINLEGPFATLPGAAAPYSANLQSDLNGLPDSAAQGVPAGFSKNTSAGVANGAVVNAAGGLEINALSSESLSDYDGSVGAGELGLAGTVELDAFTPTTIAYFGNCATAECASGASANVGSASINAQDNFSFRAVVGELSAGSASLGAAVLQATVAANTGASVGSGSSLTAANGASITSNFNDTFNAAALAGGIGGIAADVPYATITDQSDNNALIGYGARVASGKGALNLAATSKRNIAALSGAAVVGALGVGATILNVNFDGSTAATAADAANLSAGGNLNVIATLADTVPTTLPSGFTSVPVLGSGAVPTGVLGATVAGLSGVGAQVTVDDNAADTAAIGNDRTTAGGALKLIAQDSPSLNAQSGAAELGSTAAGASIAGVNSATVTSASLNGAVTAGTSLTVGSNLNETLNANATGIGVGALAGEGTVANINDASTNDVTQAGNAVSGASASLTASTQRTANAASGSSSAGLLAVGISFADVNLDGSTTATLNGNVNAGGNGPCVAPAPCVNANLVATGNDTATVNAIVNAGGGVDGVGAMAGSPDGVHADPSRIDPAITATVAPGASLRASYDDSAEADETATLNSSADGGLTGAINVGLLDAEGVADPTVLLNLAGTLSGSATYSNAQATDSVTSAAVSSESSSLLSGYSTSDGAFANPTVTLNLTGAVSELYAAYLQSNATNTVNASANALAGTFNLAAGGYTSSTAGIANTNTLNDTGNITILTPSGTETAVDIGNNTTDTIASNTATGGTGFGIATGADTKAVSTINDKSTVNFNGILNAPGSTADLAAASDESAISNATDQTSGAAAVTYVQSNATTKISDLLNVNIGNGANIQAGAFSAYADSPFVIASANATGMAEPGLEGNGYANSDFEGTFLPTINILSGAQITAPTLYFRASIGNPPPDAQSNVSGSSNATAGTNDVNGSAVANSTDNATVDPTVNLASGAILATDKLGVLATYSPYADFESNPNVNGVSSAHWVLETTYSVVSDTIGEIPLIGPLIDQLVATGTQWVEQVTGNNAAANNLGTVNQTSTIAFNSTLEQLAAATSGVSLTIAPGLQTSGSGGLSIAGVDSNNILLGGSLSNANSPLQISLITGGQANVNNVNSFYGGTVSGNPTIVEENMPAYVDITNNSNYNLVLPALSALQGNNGNISLNAQGNNVSLFANVINTDSSTAINVVNNGSGAVVFAGAINDGFGSLSVLNNGGNILDAGNSPLIVTNLSLDAPHGSIGSIAGTLLNCTICPSTALGPILSEPYISAFTISSSLITPSVSAAALGNINLNVEPIEFFPGYDPGDNVSVNLGTILAGGNVNLTLGSALQTGQYAIQFSNPFGPPQIDYIPVNQPAPSTTYVLPPGQWLASDGELYAHFGGGANAAVTLEDNGLVASGFQNLQFTLDSFGNPSSIVTMNGQSNTSLLNYLQTPGGATIGNLYSPQAGDIIFDGTGTVTGNGAMAALAGGGAVSLTNNDPNLTLTLGGFGTFSASPDIYLFGNYAPFSGTLAGSNVALADYVVNGGNSVTLFSAGGLNLTGDLNPGQLLATAAGDINAGGATVQTSGNQSYSSTGGSVNLGWVQSQGTVYASAAQNLNLETEALSNNLILGAGGAVNLNGGIGYGSVNVTAGGDITGNNTLQLNGSLDLTAGGNINLGGGLVLLDGNAELTAHGAIALGQFTVTGGTLAAGGNISANSPLQAGTLDLISTGGSIGTSANPIVLTGGATLNGSALDDINLAGAGGSLNIGNLQAGGALNLTANGGSILAAASGVNLDAASITLLASKAIGSVGAKLTGTASGSWNVNAGTGIYLVSDGDFNAGTLAAPGTNVQLTVNNGAAAIGDLEAATANLTLTQAGAPLTVNTATITNLLRASADVQNLANIVNPSPTQPLYLSLVGANNHEATSIAAEAVSQAPVIVETYSSQNGSIRDAGDWLMVEHVGIGQAATFANDWESVLVTNPGTSLAYFTGDFVGNELKTLNGTLQAAATALQPNATFTLPGTLTSYQKWMVNELILLP